MIDMAAGAVIAAARPLTRRVAISSDPEETRPPARLASANTTIATRKTRRRPNRSASRPPSSRKPPYATV